MTQPARYEVVAERREVLASRKGCDGSVVTAPKMPHLLGGLADETLLADVITSKVLDRQPMYHLSKKLERRYGLVIQRDTLARWMIQVAELCQGIVNHLVDTVMAYDVASLDATRLQVLNTPTRAPTSKSYAYCIRGGPPGKEVTLFDYNIYSASMKGSEYLNAYFAGYQGYIHTDADKLFNGLAVTDDGDDRNVTRVYCHAHARRKFEAIVKTSRKSKEAKHVMALYKQLYAVERQAKDEQMSPEARYQHRLTYARPVLDELKAYLDEIKNRFVPSRPIRKAIMYTLTHWEGLCRYLDDGRLEIDNNHTEREIKYFVMARKNFLFACTEKGADALGVLFSLVLTAQHHGLDPYAYLLHVFRSLARYRSLDTIDALLPWNVALD